MRALPRVAPAKERTKDTSLTTSAAPVTTAKVKTVILSTNLFVLFSADTFAKSTKMSNFKLIVEKELRNRVSYTSRSDRYHVSNAILLKSTVRGYYTTHLINLHGYLQKQVDS